MRNSSLNQNLTGFYLDKHFQYVAFHIVQFCREQQARSGAHFAGLFCHDVPKDEFLKVYISYRNCQQINSVLCFCYLSHFSF